MSDDGFDDYLSEEEEQDTLQQQELAAAERRLRTAGVRDGIEIGKEDTLQEGFDQGFAIGAAHSHQFSILRGALSAAQASGLFSSSTRAIQQQVSDCIQDLETKSKEHPPSSSPDAALTQAKDLLSSIHLLSPP